MVECQPGVSITPYVITRAIYASQALSRSTHYRPSLGAHPLMDTPRAGVGAGFRLWVPDAGTGGLWRHRAACWQALSRFYLARPARPISTTRSLAGQSRVCQRLGHVVSAVC